MPAPTRIAVGTGNSEDVSTRDEIKVFRDEVGESSETVCDRSSSQRDIQEEHRTLVEREERGQDHERNAFNGKGLDRSRASQFENYRHAQAFAQNFLGFQNSPSHYGYGMVPFAGFPSASSPLGSMQIPRPIPVPASGLPYSTSVPYGSPAAARRGPYSPTDVSGYFHYGGKLGPSPIGGSPVPSSPAGFMHGARNGTPPPAHTGLGGRGLFPSFGGIGSHFPVPMYQTDQLNAYWAFNNASHNAMLDHLLRQNMSPTFRPASPFPSMAPASPYSPFMMGSPSQHHMMMPGLFSHCIPPSPDATGRFSANGHVSSSRMSRADSSASSTSSNRDSSERRYQRESKKDKMSHVKKPLNAFMLYMKEQRASVQAECTLKESAAINQILGKRWHALDRTEQTKYYEMAKKERENHAKTFPGWTAKDNYAQCGKKKRRKKEKSDEPKKCRAIFGIERQGEWCKPCRRKKKCIRYSQNGTLLPTGGGEFQHEPKSSSESVSCVSSSMQALSPAADSASSNSPSSTAASTG